MAKWWFRQRANIFLAWVPISIEGWALYGVLIASIASLGVYFSILSAGAREFLLFLFYSGIALLLFSLIADIKTENPILLKRPE
ncbi:MAG TPA: hypothetical protein ENN46_03060 [Candidatus Woesearchaeota archaeon]|nr:hypothetical protein [Candidatus Woesearchaeota archaeon]